MSVMKYNRCTNVIIYVYRNTQNNIDDNIYIFFFIRVYLIPNFN